MATSTTATGEVATSREPRRLPAAGESAVKALLDHIAEDLAREYVRLMEHAAREDEEDASAMRDRREA